MITDTAVDGFLKLASAKQTGEELHKILMQLICSCLRLLDGKVPDVAVRAISMASAYWVEGEGSSHELDRIREECWEYADSIGAVVDLYSPQAIMVRAVICALYPEPQDKDFYEETVHWFFSILNKIGDFSEEFANQLRALENR